MGKSTTLATPWSTLYKKICALFERDDELQISELEKVDGNYTFSITSDNAVKLRSLEKLLKSEYEFGNVKLIITFVYLDAGADVITVSDLKNVFCGNTMVRDIVSGTLPGGATKTYVVFSKEVVQFYNDDLTDAYGNYNGLAEDIAREVFVDGGPGLSYSTDIVPIN